MAPSNLLELLEEAARHPNESGITFYAPGNVSEIWKRLTYNDLIQLARGNALLIRQMPHMTSKTKFLLHFDNHLDGIEFFWSIIVAGLVPAISTPFTSDTEQRKKHLGHLQDLLDKPIIITRKHLLSELARLREDLNVWTIEEIQSQHKNLRPAFC